MYCNIIDDINANFLILVLNPFHVYNKRKPPQMKKKETSMQLQAGQIFKNFKLLCEYLGKPVRTGKSKQLFLESLAEVVEFTQSGQSFTIQTLRTSEQKKEYKKEKEVERTQELNESVIANQRKLLIAVELSKACQLMDVEVGEGSETRVVILSFKQLDELLGLVNSKFYSASFELDKTHKGFFKEVKRANRDITEYLCQELIKKKYRIASGYFSYRITTDTKTFTLDIEAVPKIYEVQQEVLSSLGLNSISEAYLKNSLQIYYSELNVKLFEKFGIRYCEEVFVFFTNTYLMESFLEKNLKRFKKEALLRGASNDTNVKKLIKYYETHFEKELLRQQLGGKVNDVLVTSTGVEVLESVSEFYPLSREVLEENYVEKRTKLVHEFVKL